MTQQLIIWLAHNNFIILFELIILNQRDAPAWKVSMDFMFPSTSANLTTSVMVTELNAARRHMAQMKGEKSKPSSLVVKAETAIIRQQAGSVFWIKLTGYRVRPLQFSASAWEDDPRYACNDFSWGPETSLAFLHGRQVCITWLTEERITGRARFHLRTAEPNCIKRTAM